MSEMNTGDKESEQLRSQFICMFGVLGEKLNTSKSPESTD
jgi:hypothetical protein